MAAYNETFAQKLSSKKAIKSPTSYEKFAVYDANLRSLRSRLVNNNQNTASS